ncbi:MAG: carbohydrate kinase, partial [Pseudopedobacter saltans]
NINGVGIANSWVKNLTRGTSYEKMNEQAEKIAVGAEGLKIFPFGNGAERMFQNKTLNAQLCDVQFNVHKDAHVFRAVQEGIAFAFKYGLDIIQENNLDVKVIKAAHANMFLSPLFAKTFVNTLSVPVELYPVDGSVGAALAAGLGIGIFKDEAEALGGTPPIQTIEPEKDNAALLACYQEWKEKLNQFLSS